MSLDLLYFCFISTPSSFVSLSLTIYIYIYIYITTVYGCHRVDLWQTKCSRLSHTKDSKIVLDAAWLSTQHYQVRIKGKVEQSREWSSALTLHLGVVNIEKRAFGSPLTKVANFCFYIYLIAWMLICDPWFHAVFIWQSSLLYYIILYIFFSPAFSFLFLFFLLSIFSPSQTLSPPLLSFLLFLSAW